MHDMVYPRRVDAFVKYLPKVFSHLKWIIALVVLTGILMMVGVIVGGFFLLRFLFEQSTAIPGLLQSLMQTAGTIIGVELAPQIQQLETLQDPAQRDEFIRQSIMKEVVGQ